MRKRKWLWWLPLTVLVGAALVGLDQRLVIRRYMVESEKIDASVRLAVLTDLHGEDGGQDFNVLLKEVADLQPDAILLSGDLFSADGDPDAELSLFQRLQAMAPTLYVTGNHEYWEYNVPTLLEHIRATGVIVLDRNCTGMELKGQWINFCGIPDPYANHVTWDALTSATGDIRQEGFTVLLSHRPELFGQYAAKDSIDLVVSGHAHGGQIRIPLLVNGLYAPNQGWLPRYAGGRYEQDDMIMLVSRGLSAQRQMGIPRIFNRPELLLVELR